MDVGNVVGSVASAGAVLSLNTPVAITQQPASQTVNPGANVTFTVVATGTTPLTYQWKLNGTPITGATSASLTLNTAASASTGTYTVVVGNVVGSVASAGAVLSLNTPVTITQQPVSQAAFAGSNVVFSVTAVGTPPLRFQWLYNGTPIAGQTNDALSLANLKTTQAGQYAVTVTSSAGAVTSAAAVLTVAPPPTLAASLVKRPEGSFMQLKVAGLPGSACRIQSASSLGASGQWQTKSTLVLANGSLDWQDSEPLTTTYRFYRIELSK